MEFCLIPVKYLLFLIVVEGYSVCVQHVVFAVECWYFSQNIFFQCPVDMLDTRQEGFLFWRKNNNLLDLCFIFFACFFFCVCVFPMVLCSIAWWSIHEAILILRVYQLKFSVPIPEDWLCGTHCGWMELKQRSTLCKVHLQTHCRCQDCTRIGGRGKQLFKTKYIKPLNGTSFL